MKVRISTTTELSGRPSDLPQNRLMRTDTPD